MAKIAKFEAWVEPLSITQSNVLRVVKAKLAVFREKEKLEYIHSLSANFKRGILIISLWNEKGDHIGIVKYPLLFLAWKLTQFSTLLGRGLTCSVNGRLSTGRN